MAKLKVPKENIFIDKQTGKDFERDAYRAMLRRLEGGDLLYVASIVRFGRPVKDPPEDFGALVARWERGKLPLEALLEEQGLKEATFYRRLREYRALNTE
jgi:hypothetical protein